MTRKRENLIVLISILMILLGTSMVVSANGEFEIVNGMLINYSGTGGKVIIPNSVTSIKSFAFDGCRNLKEVIIPNSVKEIGKYAFRDCSSLIKVTIPNSITSIESFTFEGCSSLQEVTIPESVTRIGSTTFKGCMSLSEINVSSKNKNYTSVNGILFDKSKTKLLKCPPSNNITSYIIPESVTKIEYEAFRDCRSLTEVTIPNGITNIGYNAFKDCSSLKEVIMPNSVRNLGQSIFERCTSIKKVTVSNSIRNITDSMFKGCSSLIEITIPNSVTSIDAYAFNGCSSLQEVTIPDKVRYIKGYAFKGCSGLKEAIIPSSVTSMGDSAFSDCSNLKEVMISNSVKHIGELAFSGCSSLSEINVSAENKDYTSVGGILFDKSKTRIISYPAGNNSVSYTIPNSVTNINYSTFENCSSLEKIIIPNSVNDIKYFAFKDCSSLSEINVSAENKDYTSVDGVLFNKSKTKIIKYPEGNSRASYTIPNSVIAIESYAFWGCSKLEKIVISNSKMNIGYSAFKDCSSLSKINVSAENEGYTSVDGILFDKNKTRIIKYPAANTRTSYTVPNSVIYIDDYAFSECRKLEKIIIPNSVINIPGNVFENCNRLSEINVSAENKDYTSVDGILFNKLKTKIIKYPAGNSRKSYTISESVADIMAYAFSDCTILEKIIIPNSVTNIELDAFKDCSSDLIISGSSRYDFLLDFTTGNEIKYQ